MKTEQQIRDEISICEVAIKKLGTPNSYVKRYLDKEIETLKWVLDEE